MTRSYHRNHCMTSPHITAAALWLGAGLLGCGAAGAVPAATPAATPAGATGILTGHLAEGSPYDQLWSVPLLYKDETHPVLQELAIQGQLQTQYAHGSAGDSGQYSSGDLTESCTWDEVEVRRFRLGVRARLFREFKFHSLLDLYPDLSPRFYQRTAEAYLTYAPCDAFNLAVGKAELKFTREQEISSSEYLTFERSQLVNMFYGGELTGAWVCGKGLGGGWLYHLGAYGNDRQDEWSDLGGGAMVLAKLGYNYSKRSGMDLALVQLHWLHNTTPGYKDGPGDFSSPRFSDGLALSNDLTVGRFGLAAEVLWGNGAHGQPNVGGLTLMPTWFLAEKLQLVTTLQVAVSNGTNGICLPTRYEAQIPGGKNITGDAYWGAYAGLNYYFYGYKLKVMLGGKFSQLEGGTEDFHGWGWLTGCRCAF